jgi:DNA (cytosine-5)-methyltransferase 1
MGLANLSVASFFAGAGGLDLGFRQAGFQVTWANEYDKDIWATYEFNHEGIVLDRRSIADINPAEVPEVAGYIGGPPCQSWSEAGARRGIDDHRGMLFFNYLEMIRANLPAFFQAENVSGILAARNRSALDAILQGFANLGYNVSYGLVRASHYNVPQDRDRVFIIGYRTDLGKVFNVPVRNSEIPTLRSAIWDLREGALPASGSESNGSKLSIANHEYMTGTFSTIYMSRNRVRNWDEPSFTIQAGARHAPIHPQAPKMVNIAKDQFEFKRGYEHLYRRVSVREAARIQTFPDSFEFLYKRISDGYKMIGNAVPVRLAEAFAQAIFNDLGQINFGRAPKKLQPGIVAQFGQGSTSKLELDVFVSA